MGRRSFKVTVNGETYQVEVEEVGSIQSERTQFATDSSETVDNNVDGEGSSKDANTEPKAADNLTEQSAGKKDEPQKPSAAEGTSVTAPMPGSIIEIKVQEGDSVKEDDVLLILEAMKMENEVTSPAAGTVTKVLVNKGSSVNSGETLVVIG